MRILLSFIFLTLFSLNNFAQATETTKAAEQKTIAEAEAFERDLISALRKGDRTSLERMLAEGFIFIHSTGGLETREEYLKNANGGNLLLQRTEFENLDTAWSVYGDTAIRYGRTIMRNKAAGTENRMRNISVYVKKDGRWLWASGQSTKLPVRPKAAQIDARLYGDYAGQYKIGGERTFTVTKENGVLFGLVTGRNKAELIPASETVFVWFNENNDVGFVEVVFVRGADGKTSEAFLRQNGQEMWRAKKSNEVLK